MCHPEPWNKSGVNSVEDNSEGECCDHACMGITEPKSWGVAPSSGGLPKILIAVDGNLKIDKMPQDIQMPIVKGDGRIASISAASILAKVFRDRYMDRLAQEYPGYGFEKHAGYGTKAHLDAIRRQGFTPAHRKSFHPKSL